tara:strand:+ start:8650 stop:8838 length:189 start_codon:yes stop_codon:yes gene_type:complete
MKIGDRVLYRLFSGHTGTIVDIEQHGNTPMYVVQWDELCPMTGQRKPTSTVSGELEVLSENE